MSTRETPSISRAFEDGTLTELLYDPATAWTAFAVASPDGQWSVKSSFIARDGERLIPYPASNNLLATRCVLLPSRIGKSGTKEEALAAVRAFLHRYVDLPDLFEEIAAHYVLLTWVYDAFTDLPYLRFQGDFGSGKTRALMVIGSLCYKPFFASGASTVSPIFHIQDAFRGTLVLDEADFRFSDATAPLTKLLNNGTTRGMPVLRTMTNRNRELNPQAFHVFGPKLVAMRERFSDLALESRFLTCTTGTRPLRPDVPIHLPKTFDEEALDLRNMLLAWRFRSRFSVGPDPSRAAAGVAPRYRQASLALLSLVDDSELRIRIVRELAGEEARVLDERAGTLEAAMLTALVEGFSVPDVTQVRVNDLAAHFNGEMAEHLGRPMSNKWVGSFLRTRLGLRTRKSNGTYAIGRDQLERVSALALRYGVTEAASSPQFSTEGQNSSLAVPN